MTGVRRVRHLAGGLRNYREVGMVAKEADQDRKAEMVRIREELRLKGKLKHRPGPSYCIVCGVATACEWIDIDDVPDPPRSPACPEHAAHLHHHPDERAALLPGYQVTVH